MVVEKMIQAARSLGCRDDMIQAAGSLGCREDMIQAAGSLVVDAYKQKRYLVEWRILTSM